MNKKLHIINKGTVMGFRFRKSFTLIPGLRINLSKSGLSSMSMGPRGASMSFGRLGTYGNIGIPGTGISFRNKIGGGSSKREKARERKILKKIEEEAEEIVTTSKITLDLNEETGVLEMFNEAKEPLSKTSIKNIWDQKSDFIKEWLQSEADKINGDIDLLENIYLDTLNPNQVANYVAKPFPGKKPEKPSNPPVKEETSPLGFFSKLFQSNREKYEYKLKEVSEKYEQEVKVWEELLNKYNQEVQEWEEEKKVFEEREKKYEDSFEYLIDSDIDFMEMCLEDVLDSLTWPKETIISYEIDDKGKEIWVDVDLPEIEDFPQKVAKLSVSEKRLNVKQKSQKQLRVEYAKHIHGIAFRLISAVFATLTKVELVVVSGYSQRLNKALGKIEHHYLYSFKVDRKRFSEINFDSLDQVDPIEALDFFEHKKKMTATGIFKPVDPLKK